MYKFDEKKFSDNLNGALKLRGQINEIVDKICDEGYKDICWLGIGGTWASALQVEVHMKEKSKIDFFVENAAEYIVTGNKKICEGTIIVISSVSGTTSEMIEALKIAKKHGARVLGFIDKKESPLSEMVDWSISYPLNEQLKFFMVADRFMFNKGEFDQYEDVYDNFDKNLSDALIEATFEADEFGKEFAQKHHDDYLHYFVGAGNQYGATYSYAMCYWEEQHWIRTKSIRSEEFFHGMFEIVDRDTNITVFVGEDSQRPLSERVAKFIPKVCANYTIIDTKDYKLTGIKKEYRQYISHLVMRQICSRIDVYIEKLNCHPMDIRRYYRALDY